MTQRDAGQASAHDQFPAEVPAGLALCPEPTGRQASEARRMRASEDAFRSYYLGLRIDPR